MTRTLIRGTVAGLLALASAACGTGARGAARATPKPAVGMQVPVAGPARARADSARYPYTEADVHFMSAMIGHHSQAITISRWAPTHGAKPAVLRLAERIINAQQDEIATMQRWLRDRDRPAPGAGASMMTHDSKTHGAMTAAPGDTTHGGGHGAGHTDAGAAMMPGMLSAAQLAQLDAARGPEFDRLFLTFMIQHHRGAVSMVQQLFATDGAGQDETVFKFASDVNVDQVTEIARMQRLILDLVFETK